jgi:4-hydroxymandelate oxidase
MTIAHMSPEPLSADDLRRIASVAAFEEAARTRLTPMAYAYYAGGSGAERTLARNADAWSRLSVWYRVMVDVSQRSTATALLGHRIAAPLLVAPTALHRMACDDGELATVRACGAAGVPMVVSSLSTTRLEEVCAQATGPVLFQLYIGQDRPFVRDLAQRAESAGCAAIELTVDTPVWGLREREQRTGFRVPDGMGVVNLYRDGHEGPTGHSGVGIAQALGWTIDASLSWRDLEWLCAQTRLPVLVKGICRADDARHALASGAAGIVVSNHGGRQLDGAPATAEALPHVVDAVAGRAPVVVDGGIRSGTDILRALALGATAVQVGRPVLWGLAVAGEAGAQRVLELLIEDLSRSMALAGCPDVAAVTRDLLSP